MVGSKTLAQVAEEFAGWLAVLKSQHVRAEDAVTDGNRIHDDILHRMERQDCLYPERARLATRLAESQRVRRAYKDWLISNKGLIRWAESAKGKQLENLLGEFVGVARESARKEP